MHRASAWHGYPGPADFRIVTRHRLHENMLCLIAHNHTSPLTKNGKEEYFLKVSRILRQRNAQQTGKKERKFP